MYLVIHIQNSGDEERIRRYIKTTCNCRIWEYTDPCYVQNVTAEQRKALMGPLDNLNPPFAWKSCASYQGDETPVDNLYLSGTCDCPSNLNTISCVKSCTKYVPRSFEALISMATNAAIGHDTYGSALRNYIAHLMRNQELWSDVQETGGVIGYENGHFVIKVTD